MSPDLRLEPAAAVFDPSELHRLFGGLGGAAQALLTTFLAQTQAECEQIQIAATQRDKGLRKPAHDMAGRSAIIGARRLALIASALEHAAIAGDWPQVDALVSRLSRDVDEVAAAIARLTRDSEAKRDAQPAAARSAVPRSQS